MNDTLRESTYASRAYGCKKLIDIYCCIAQLFQMSCYLLFLASTGLCHKASKKHMNAGLCGKLISPSNKILADDSSLHFSVCLDRKEP